jgi:hypothetical protein
MTTMDEEPTCGKGLAEHSALPAKLAELMAALADVLDMHQKALDLSDEHARRERDAYAKLTEEHRQIAAQLRTSARHMSGYRDLPMGKHNEEAMAAPEAVEAFAKFVRVEQQLLILLQAAVDRDQKMLVEMGREG